MNLIFNFFKSYPGLEQYAIKKFAEAFEIVPKTLAENTGHKVITLFKYNLSFVLVI